MSNLVDILVDRRERQRTYFDNPRRWVSKIGAEVADELPKLQVFLFGSVLEDETTPGSDIDVLLYSPAMPSHQRARAELAASLTDLLGYTHPFELHFADDEQLAWYRRFARLEEVRCL